MSTLAKNPEYRRLKVEGYGPLGTASYWLGPDHLLVVVTSNYVENYQRFLYGDIQALLIRHSPLRTMWGTVFSLLTIVSLLGAWAVRASSRGGNPTSEEWYGLGALLAIALVFATLQTMNLLRGRTCVCHLRTAVQTLALPHLTRWRKADLLIAELTPLALAMQGVVAAARAEAAERPPAPHPPPEPAEPPITVAEDPNIPPQISS